MLDRVRGHIPDDSEIRTMRQSSSRVRQRLEDDVDHLKDQAHELFDWKHYVRKHPFAAISIAFAAGYFLVPRRRDSAATCVNAETISAADSTPMVEPSPAKSQVRVVGESLLRSALLITGQRIVQGILDHAFESSKPTIRKGAADDNVGLGEGSGRSSHPQSGRVGSR